MSLLKIYYLTCEARSVLMTRQQAAGATLDEIKANHQERKEITSGCVYSTEETHSAKDARAQAKKAGWVRHVEQGKYGAERFDVCPVCAPRVVQP